MIADHVVSFLTCLEIHSSNLRKNYKSISECIPFSLLPLFHQVGLMAGWHLCWGHFSNHFLALQAPRMKANLDNLHLTRWQSWRRAWLLWHRGTAASGMRLASYHTRMDAQAKRIPRGVTEYNGIQPVHMARYI
mgnify:CR=1 FL=1